MDTKWFPACRPYACICQIRWHAIVGYTLWHSAPFTVFCICICIGSPQSQLQATKRHNPAGDTLRLHNSSQPCQPHTWQSTHAVSMCMSTGQRSISHDGVQVVAFTCPRNCVYHVHVGPRRKYKILRLLRYCQLSCNYYRQTTYFCIASSALK